MSAERHLDWPGCSNVRDLGGLTRNGGGWTRRGRIVRGDAAQQLTAAGWDALHGFGVRTVVDLQEPDDAGADQAPRPHDLGTHHAPLDDATDVEFWTRWGAGLDCTPLYYSAFLDRFPERVAHVVALVADVPAGAVLVHCGSGRDRTGLIALVLLRLAGATPEAIAQEPTTRSSPPRASSTRRPTYASPACATTSSTHYANA